MLCYDFQHVFYSLFRREDKKIVFGVFRCYLEKFKSCRRTLMFLENWLTYCNLDSNEISFFALAWFVIFYYQNVHKYPSLQEVSHSNGSSKKITSKFLFID